MSMKKTKLNIAALQISISNLANESLIKNFKPNPVQRNSNIKIDPELEKLFGKANLNWLQSLNRLNPGETIISRFNRRNESVLIVVDCNGKFVRLAN